MFSFTPSLSSSTSSVFVGTSMATREPCAFGQPLNQFGTSMGTREPSAFVGTSMGTREPGAFGFGTSMGTREPSAFVGTSMGTREPGAFGFGLGTSMGTREPGAFGQTPYQFGTSVGTREPSVFGQTPNQFGTSMGTRGPTGFGQFSSLNPFYTNQFGTSMETRGPFSFTPGSIGTKGPFSPSYTDTIVYDEISRTHDCRMVSISAMPDYKLKSHEELRWEDYHLFNARGRVDPAFVHPNAFSFPRTDTSIFSRPLPTYVPSNQAELKSVLDKMEELDKSAQLLCKDIKSCIKRFEKYRYLKLENILHAHATHKDAIIADYLESQAFTKRLDEEYERRLSKIFHPCYVKTLCEAQAKLPDHAFKSSLLFGQTSNLNASSTIPFGSQFMSGQSSGTNMFGSTSTSVGGTSMGLFGSMQETPLWGSSSASMSSSTDGFGFGPRVGFGQSLNPNVSSTGASGSQYTFGQSSNPFPYAPNNGGTSTAVFGGNPFGQSIDYAPNNGGTSTGVFGQTMSSSSFGQSSNLFGCAPNIGGTSTGLCGQTASSTSFGQNSNLIGSAPSNGETSMGVFGQNTWSAPSNGGTSMGVFGQNTSPLSFPSKTTSSSPIIWSSSTGCTTFPQVPASIASSSSGFGSGCMTDCSQETVPWGRISLSGPPSIPSNPIYTTVTTPSVERKLSPSLDAGQYEELNQRVNFNNTSVEKHTSIHAYENGKVGFLSAPVQNGSLYQDKDGNSSETEAAEHNRKGNSVQGDHPLRIVSSSNVYELMPKLKQGDYFIEPGVEELAIKESYEPGFCSHVNGLVVGRHGYGSIKFLEDTDVRELDLESFIEFRNGEVIVYMNKSKKPPVGQGLNKAAEITLCNIWVVDKKTGKQYTNGPNVDKFREKLMKKAAEQGGEFVSYDPVQGEWKFIVQHF